MVQPAAQNQRNPENATSPRRLLTLLFVGNLAMYPTLFGVPGLLLPSQLETIDAAGKVANFALIAALAAAVGAIAQPVAGAFSDRARPRFGRRPFLISGAAVAAVLLWLLGLASTILAVLLLWSAAMLALNVYQAAIVALVPDHIARERRGRASSLIAVTVPIGLVLGLAVGAGSAPSLAYGILGGLLLAAAVVILIWLPADTSPLSVGRRTAGWEALRHRDFRLALAGRFGLFLGFLLVDNFLLFVLQDYSGVPAGWTAEVGVLTVGVISAAGLLATSAVCGILSDRIGRRKLFVLVGLVLYAVAVVPVLLMPNWTTMVVFALVGGLGFGCYYALDTAIGSLVLPSRHDHARDLGIFNLGYVAATIAGPILGGVLIGATANYQVLFVAGLALAAAGTADVLAIRSIR